MQARIRLCSCVYWAARVTHKPAKRVPCARDTWRCAALRKGLLAGCWLWPAWRPGSRWWTSQGAPPPCPGPTQPNDRNQAARFVGTCLQCAIDCAPLSHPSPGLHRQTLISDPGKRKEGDHDRRSCCNGLHLVHLRILVSRAGGQDVSRVGGRAKRVGESMVLICRLTGRASAMTTCLHDRWIVKRRKVSYR